MKIWKMLLLTLLLCTGAAFASSDVNVQGDVNMQAGQGSTLGAAANYFTDSSKVSPENATVVPGDEGGEELAGSGNPLIDHAQSVVTGFDKGAADTAHSLGRVANAATGNNISALPTSFTEPDYLKSDNGYEAAGKDAASLLLVGTGLLVLAMFFRQRRNQCQNRKA